ncbi:type II toxin-antitoxin system RelE/ParE family toxin [Beijerinckia sp. L45]|uniref:type II toxin-antitoxin system RelE/ParE family toxin n=1 Tax=Beijerinckia sp. L45 TaxID=1641855 RepID=UPI00131BC720|nr:type II toxin-antitoxin system RelE/ParE family toxin [Beijerinckia sp. L45]
MRLVFTVAARLDLVAIGDTIAQDNPVRAVSYIDEIERRCRKLLDVPHVHALVPRHENTGLRRIVHGPYLIFYRVTGDVIEILRILHGARDYETILFSPPQNPA